AVEDRAQRQRREQRARRGDHRQIPPPGHTSPRDAASAWRREVICAQTWLTVLVCVPVMVLKPPRRSVLSITAWSALACCGVCQELVSCRIATFGWCWVRVIAVSSAGWPEA